MVPGEHIAMMQPEHGHSGDFGRTQWSMVQRLKDPRSEAAHHALAGLAVRYWYPVYAYVRRCGHAPAIAQDITRSFLQQVAADFRGDKDAPVGRFRDWLLQRLNAFLAGDWQDLVVGEAFPSAPRLEDLERRNAGDHATNDSPDQVFQRSFALEILANGFKALRTEASQTGHLDMYEALEPFLVREPAPGQYDELGKALGVRPLALVLALKRLRQRFRELVSRELADIVASPDDLSAEQRSLFATLHGRGL